MMLRNHTDVLNYIVTSNNLQSYLEIGVNVPANNFDKIKVKDKIGVDPNPKSNATFTGTSNDFFYEGFIPKRDLIFIDGDHTYQQVKMDFENSVKRLSENGFIVIHDTVPIKEIDTLIPRQTKRWNGDVYKFALELHNYDNIKYCTLPFDSGITVMKVKQRIPFPDFENTYDWNFYMKNKKLLNLISTIDFVKWVNKKQLV